MSIIIADSGSTKTDWVAINKGGKITTSNTLGFNPYYYAPEELSKNIQDKVIPQIKSFKLKSLYFYGSGISTKNKKKLTKSTLEKNFPNTHIEVEHDLLAAARGLFQNKSGMACIMGTGSNSCVYNGKEITHNIPSLGYFFADEGSGTHIGKLFIEDYLRDNLPSDLRKLAEKKYNLSNESILNNIYNQSNPNKFLASFSLFVNQNIDQLFLQELVKKSFRLFFQNYIINYPNYRNMTIRFVGRVAFANEKTLRETANEFGLKINMIKASPIEGLIKYHTKHYS